MAEEPRVFKPVILQTKQDLLIALRAGQLRTSFYNSLNENEKLFVELVCFGNYTGEAAVKAIDPTVYNPKLVANRMMANPKVRECMEELTVAKDTKFKSEAVSARDTALATLTYIMKTSKDESVRLAAAKVILEKTNDYMKNAAKKEQEEGVTNVEYHIRVDTLTVNSANQSKREGREPIIIPDDEEEEPVTINPETGLPYVLMYEGVNNYQKEDGDDGQDGGESGASSEVLRVPDGVPDDASGGNTFSDAIRKEDGDANSDTETDGSASDADSDA